MEYRREITNVENVSLFQANLLLADDNILILPLHPEALLAEHVGQRCVGKLGKVHTLLFSALLIEDDEVRVVPLDPLHLKILPLLPALLLFQPTACVIEVI